MLRAAFYVRMSGGEEDGFAVLGENADVGVFYEVFPLEMIAVGLSYSSSMAALMFEMILGVVFEGKWRTWASLLLLYIIEND
jgi:hypothetical protein